MASCKGIFLAAKEAGEQSQDLVSTAFPSLQLTDSLEILTIGDYIFKLLVGTNRYRTIYSLNTA